MSEPQDLLDYCAQLRTEIREGEWLLASMQHLKREGKATQADANELRSDIEFLRREHEATRIRALAIVNGIVLPEPEVSDMTCSIRVRMKVYRTREDAA